MRQAVTIEDLRRGARRRLPKAVFDYIDGGAGDEITLRNNSADFDAITFRPRVLVDVATRDLSIPILGRTAPLPLIVAPTGLSALARPRADQALARAAAANSVPIILSSNSSIRIEDFARAAPEGRRWFQIYVYRDHDLVRALVRRALAADYEALVLTVDVPVLGQRERDHRNGFTIPLRLSPRLVFDVLRCPGWSIGMARNGVPRIENFIEPGARPERAGSMISVINSKMDPSLKWDDVTWLREIWPRKLVIKGVLSAADAEEAVKRGFDAIAVSNHGGRQTDGAPSSIAALPAIVQAVNRRAEIYLDGGIRRGASIAKALALGANAVMIGRPTLYGVAADGEAGALAALSILRDEFDRCLALIGCPVAAKLERVFVDCD
jgi:(S)-mandelate dehydrogenase